MRLVGFIPAGEGKRGLTGQRVGGRWVGKYAGKHPSAPSSGNKGLFLADKYLLCTLFFAIIEGKPLLAVLNSAQLVSVLRGTRV